MGNCKNYAESKKTDKNTKILVLGTGFAGTSFLESFNRNLRKSLRSSIEVTAIDSKNYLMFAPLLYQVATGQVYEHHISVPVCCKVRRRGFKFLETQVEKITPEKNEVVTSNGSLFYDKLILALGTETNDFGINGVSEYAIPLKSLKDGEHIRNRILESIKAVVNSSHGGKSKSPTFVIIGGGASGVELAGSLVEYLRVLAEDYQEHGLNPRVILVEARDRLMENLPLKFSEKLKSSLEKLGVEILTDAKVAKIVPGKVVFSNGNEIESDDIFWTAGVKSNPVAAMLAESLNQKKGGRIAVNAYLKIPGSDSIYVLGDNAAPAIGAQGSVPPQTAAAAVQEGKYAGRALARIMNGDSNIPTFHYKDPGMMLSLGRFSGLCRFSNGLMLSGFSAWVIWRFVHLLKITTFKNRIEVFSDWIFSSFHRSIVLKSE